MSAADTLAALLVVVIWGVNFAVAKIGLEQLPPLLMMTLRFALVALLLVPFVPVPRGRLKPIFWLSFTLGFVHFSLMFVGLQYVDASTAAILVQIQVPFAALLAAIVFKDRLGWRRAGGMAVAFAGVVILVGGPRAGGPLWAIALVIAAALTWAVANLLMKHLSDVSGFAVNGWMGLFAAPQLLAASLLLEHGQRAAMLAADWRGWGAVLYQTVLVVILCYGLWYGLLRRYPVSQVMPWSLLIPVFGVLSGVVMLGEPVTWTLVAGGAVTVAGVAVIVVQRARPTEGAQPGG